MKYTFSHYAEAFCAACGGKTEKEQKKIARQFLLFLQKHREIRNLPPIVHAVEKRELRNAGARKVLLQSPFPADERVKKEIKRIFGKTVFQEETRADLLGGMRILVDDELLVDASAKRQLERMLV